MSSSYAPVMILAGGTGGHIFPGIAVGLALIARGVPVIWLGATGGLETRLVPAAGIAIETISISGIRGKGWRALLGAPLNIVRALSQAVKIMRRIRPGSVIAFGGFAAGPGGIVAWILRYPLVVHEQNRIPGVTNRILAIFAKKLLCGFDGVFPARQGEWVGNPVRREIAITPPPELRMGGRDGAIRLLVLGGSQGAQGLNTALPRALGQLPANLQLQVRHQCGVKHLQRARDNYAAIDVEVTVEAFIEDMAAAYCWADFVVCRSGALTLAELCAVGIGAILVPFPQAVDDHQTRNAEAMTQCGAAVLVSEGPQFDGRLAQAIVSMVNDPERRLAMAQAARCLAKPDAAQRIADVCLQVAV